MIASVHKERSPNFLCIMSLLWLTSDPGKKRAHSVCPTPTYLHQVQSVHNFYEKKHFFELLLSKYIWHEFTYNTTTAE